jgi:hypothetical protein
MVIRQAIGALQCPTEVIIIAQEWPCWLALALALKLPIKAAYFPKEFQTLFATPAYAPPADFAAMWMVPPDWDDVMVFASGSTEYLNFVLPKLKHHQGPFVTLLILCSRTVDRVT